MWNWIKKSEIWENIVLIIGVFSLWPTIALRDKPLEAYSGWVGVYRRYLGLLILVLLIILALGTSGVLVPRSFKMGSGIGVFSTCK